MKSVVFAGLIFVLSSFVNIDQKDKTNNVFYATVNGELFRTRTNPFVEVAEPNSSSIGSTSASIVKLNFPGPVYTLRDGKQFVENLQFLFGYTANGEIDSNYYALLNYQGEYYYVVKELSKVELTDFEFNPVSGSVFVNANFDCTMRNYNYKLNNKKDIRLTGKMQNLMLRSNTRLSAGL
ncbi:MAG: hypothetical protein U0V74_17140 [Chitinophagales bacterium]